MHGHAQKKNTIGPYYVMYNPPHKEIVVLSFIASNHAGYEQSKSNFRSVRDSILS